MPRRDFTKVPFAATGDVTSIPTAVQPDGSVSMAAGFGFDYQRDNGAGGGTPDPLAKSIPRDATNGILNEITASIGEIQLNGLAIWAASAAPYPINATVRHNNTNWRSTVANNSAQPGVSPLANWIDMTAPIAQATESAAGIAAIASPTQATTGADNTVIMTPGRTTLWWNSLRASPSLAPTETQNGLIIIASDAFVSQGTNDTRAITPLKLKNRLDVAIQQATEIIAGVSKIATQLITNAGTNDTDSVTPLKLFSWWNSTKLSLGATESAAGIAAIATTPQAVEGSDDTRIMTPAKVSSWFAGLRASPSLAASESQNGVLYIASDAFVNQGTDNTRAITPLKLKNRLDLVVRQASPTVVGISRFGTPAEQLAGVLSTVASNPAGVLSQLTAMFPKRTFTASDYIRIPDVPGGLIIQWGSTAQIAANGTVTTNLPIAFPSLSLKGFAFYDGGVGGTSSSTYAVDLLSRSQISVKNFSTGNSTPSYIAIGY